MLDHDGQSAIDFSPNAFGVPRPQSAKEGKVFCVITTPKGPY